MKKKSLLLITLILGITIIFTGCSSSESASGDEGEKIDGNLTVAGGSVGGIWSVFTEGVSESVRREYPGTLISAEPGTVAGNPVVIGENKIDFALSESLTAMFAYEGEAPFDKKYEDIRAVASLMPDNIFQFVAPESASFDSVEDIVDSKTDLRYSPGEKDALGDVVSKGVFEAYNLTYKNIEENNGGEINYLSGGKTFELMSDARIDGLGKMVPIPAGDILEASATIDLKLIPIGDKAIDYLEDKYSMKPFTMEAGSYDFQDEDYQTVSSPTILITNAEMSDEVVYQMTKSIYNQLEYLYDVHNGFKPVNDETIVEVGGVPLHPGAEKFFKEEGLLD